MGSENTYELCGDRNFDALVSRVVAKMDGDAAQAFFNGLVLLEMALDARAAGKVVLILDEATGKEEEIINFWVGDRIGDPTPTAAGRRPSG